MTSYWENEKNFCGECGKPIRDGHFCLETGMRHGGPTPADKARWTREANQQRARAAAVRANFQAEDDRLDTLYKRASEELVRVATLRHEISEARNRMAQAKALGMTPIANTTGMAKLPVPQGPFLDGVGMIQGVAAIVAGGLVWCSPDHAGALRPWLLSRGGSEMVQEPDLDRIELERNATVAAATLARDEAARMSWEHGEMIKAKIDEAENSFQAAKIAEEKLEAEKRRVRKAKAKAKEVAQ